MIQDYLERLLGFERIEELWPFHCDAMAGYGFDRLLYGFSRLRTSRDQIASDDFLILSNHSPEYLGPFVERGMYFHAPMIRWAFENVGACSFGWIAESSKTMTPEERRVMEFNRLHGVTAGYTISFKGVSARSNAAIGLVAQSGTSQEDVDAVWGAHGRDIMLMNQVAHLRISTLPFIGRHTLTPRQREVLEWVGEGKTTQDISVILGVAEATVEKHLRLAREVLEAETTAQAVLKASLQNQIFVVET